MRVPDPKDPKYMLNSLSIHRRLEGIRKYIEDFRKWKERVREEIKVLRSDLNEMSLKESVRLRDEFLKERIWILEEIIGEEESLSNERERAL